MTRSFLWRRTEDRCWGNIVYILSGAGPIQPGRPSIWFDIQQLQGTYKKVRTFILFLVNVNIPHSRLLVLIPTKRLTAKAVLAHPWLAFDHKTAELGRWQHFPIKDQRLHDFILILEWLAWRLLVCVDIWLDGDGWSSEDPSRSSIFILLFYS